MSRGCGRVQREASGDGHRGRHASDPTSARHRAPSRRTLRSVRSPCWPRSRVGIHRGRAPRRTPSRSDREASARTGPARRRRAPGRSSTRMGGPAPGAPRRRARRARRSQPGCVRHARLGRSGGRLPPTRHVPTRLRQPLHPRGEGLHRARAGGAWFTHRRPVRDRGRRHPHDRPTAHGDRSRALAPALVGAHPVGRHAPRGRGPPVRRGGE